jgi:hypothetical protein
MRSIAEGFERSYSELERGWIQGTDSSPDGVCAIGALEFGFDATNKELTNNVRQDVALQLRWFPYFRFLWTCCSILYRDKNQQRRDFWWSLAKWNDAPWRRESTVLNVFKRLAAKYEKDLMTAS